MAAAYRKRGQMDRLGAGLRGTPGKAGRQAGLFYGGERMLILTRKVNESIVIGGNIEVMVVLIQGDKVKLGILAPLEVPVHRKEIARRIRDGDQ